MLAVRGCFDWNEGFQRYGGEDKKKKKKKKKQSLSLKPETLNPRNDWAYQIYRYHYYYFMWAVVWANNNDLNKCLWAACPRSQNLGWAKYLQVVYIVRVLVYQFYDFIMNLDVI